VAKKKKNAAGRGSLRKAKKAIKGRTKKPMGRQDWRELAGILGRDAGPGVRRKAANPGVKVEPVGKGTGWMKARRVKIVRRGRRVTVLVEKAPRKKR
jgi:hypothetical protein